MLIMSTSCARSNTAAITAASSPLASVARSGVLVPGCTRASERGITPSLAIAYSTRGSGNLDIFKYLTIHFLQIAEDLHGAEQRGGQSEQRPHAHHPPSPGHAGVVKCCR